MYYVILLQTSPAPQFIQSTKPRQSKQQHVFDAKVSIEISFAPYDAHSTKKVKNEQKILMLVCKISFGFQDGS